MPDANWRRLPVVVLFGAQNFNPPNLTFIRAEARIADES